MQVKFEYFDINKRIVLIMNNKGFNKNSLSKLLGVSQPALKKIEDGENLPSLKLIFEILSKFPDVNTEWLITGKGQMLKSCEIIDYTQTKDPKDEIIELQRFKIKSLESEINKLIKK